MNDPHQEAHCHAKGPARRKIPVLPILGAGLITLYVLGFFVPSLGAYRYAFSNYLGIVWWALALGVLIGGVIERYVPGAYVSKILSRPGRATIFNAVFLGFLMSACSHGILAIAMELHRKGASAPAVVSFLLASPWANFAFTLLLIGFFGAVPAVVIILGAVLIALITGFIFLALEARGWVESNPRTAAIETGFSIRADIRRRWRGRRRGWGRIPDDARGIWRGSRALAAMIFWWIFIGMGLASLAAAYVPAGIFERYLGPTVLGLLATLGLAAVMEICSEGTAPLAFEIYKQTAALGNSFAFLMGGVVTDYTEIGLLWHNIGKKTALWLVVVSVPQVFLLGWILNLLF